MPIVTIKPIRRKTSVPKAQIKKAVKAAVLALGKPHSIAVRIRKASKAKQ